MRIKYFLITLFIMSSFLLFNCSEVEEDISEPEELEGVHPDGFGKLGSANFHGVKLKANTWNMTGCIKCHGADYAGGITDYSCLDCHTNEAGPEACNTCHGSFADESRIAPPTDLDNNIETSAKGVGAHTAHVYDNNFSLPISCGECHPGNDGGSVNYVSAHIDGLPAEMQFGEFASSGLTEPEYSFSNLNCANTYCHGNFDFDGIVGNNYNPVWNIVDGTEGACGTCHGVIDAEGNLETPLPSGHFGNFTIDNCFTCHSTAFEYYNSSDDFEFNKSNHINGEKNLN